MTLHSEERSSERRKPAQGQFCPTGARTFGPSMSVSLTRTAWQDKSVRRFAPLLSSPRERVFDVKSWTAAPVR